MKRIELSIDDSKALANLRASGQRGVEVVEKIFRYYKEELISIKNIDNKGNMGLQALARQNALLVVEEMEDIIFADEEVQPRGEVKQKSPWR